MRNDKELKSLVQFKNGSARKIFIIYLVIGGLWILFSDMFLSWFISEPELQYKMQTPKGWFFIIVTGIVLYFLVKRDIQVANKLYEKEYKSRITAENAKLKLEESEVKYRTLIEQASDGIFLFDSSGRYLDVNESGLKLLGYSKDELLQLTIRDTIDKENLSNSPIRFDELVTGQIIITERIFVNKEGSKIPVETSKRQLPDGTFHGIMRDITERKINEQILAESEKKYKSLFMSNPNPMWVYDLDTLKFLDVNEAAVKNYGYTRNEFLSMTIKEIRPEEDVIKLIENIKSADHGLEYSTGWRHLKKDGSIIYVDIRSNFIEYSGSKAKLVSAIDITLRKKAEEELKESTEKLKAFFDSNLIGIIFSDIYGAVHEANDKFLKIIGYSRDDLKNGLIRWDTITPEEYRLLDENGINEARISGICTPYEKKYLRKDGSLIWVFVGYILIGEKREQAVAFILDLTLLKEAEIRQNELRFEKDELLKMHQLQIERMPVGYVLFDEELNIKFWNPAAEKIFGYSEKEMISRQPFGLILKESQRKFFEQLRKEWLRGNMTAHSINENITKDGRTITCEWINTPLIDENGKFNQLLSMVQDITERKNSETEINRQREELRALASHLQSIREKERIAISRELHDELGQILTSIKMNMIFMGKELKKQLSDYDVDYFENEINAMSQLLDRSVKSVRKIITNLRPDVLVNLDLIDALEWQVEEFNKIPGIKCTFICECDKRNFNNEFTTAFFRILQEALTNVRRHSSAKTVTVNLNYTTNHMILSIIDDGVGIKHVRQIRAKSFGLLGIRERAILLGGSMELKSSPGKGTELFVSVPL